MRPQQSTISLTDFKAAYLLALEFLPRRDVWFTAVASRRDGTSAEAIFRIFDAIRTEYLARIGDLAAGSTVPSDWSFHLPDASFEDQVVAFSMVVSSLPQSPFWRVVIANRCGDGSTPEGVLAGLDAIRWMFHACIGAMSNVASDSPTHSAQA